MVTYMISKDLIFYLISLLIYYRIPPSSRVLTTPSGQCFRYDAFSFTPQRLLLNLLLLLRPVAPAPVLPKLPLPIFVNLLVALCFGTSRDGGRLNGPPLESLRDTVRLGDP